MRPPDRTVALAVALVGGVAFVALAWWLVPWDPVPGGPVRPIAATDVFTAEEIRRAEDYSRWARLWGWSGLLVSLVVACWLGFTRVGGRLVARLPGTWWVQVVLAVAAVELLGRVATLPLAAAGHRLRLDAGLATQAWGGWLRDVVVSQALVMVTTALVVLPLVAAARRWRRWWPAVGASLVAGFVLLGSFVYPLLVEPLFNDFEPLPDGELRSRILTLAERQQVELDDVLVADASRRTTTLNAYVSGLGSTRRVVVYDNLVDDAEQDQVLAVVAHELAHAAHQDVVRGTVLAMAGAGAGVGLLALVVGRWSRQGVRDPRSVPMLLAVVAVASMLTAPVENGISRRIETRADVEALRATGDPEAFVALQRALAVRSLADPTPPAWAQWWFGSHPTALERVAMARRSARGRVHSFVYRVAGVAEQAVDPTAQEEDCCDDQGGDARDQQTVLDRGRPVFRWRSRYIHATHLSLKRMVPADIRRDHPSVVISGAGVAAVHRLAGVREDTAERVTEDEHDGHDQCGDAGDQQAVLHGRGAALLHLGEAGVDQGLEKVEHSEAPLQ